MMQPAVITDVRVDDRAITFVLSDGRELSAPTTWSRRLSSAKADDRAKWEIGGRARTWSGRRSTSISASGPCSGCRRTRFSKRQGSRWSVSERSDRSADAIPPKRLWGAFFAAPSPRGSLPRRGSAAGLAGAGAGAWAWRPTRRWDEDDLANREEVRIGEARVGGENGSVRSPRICVR